MKNNMAFLQKIVEEMDSEQLNKVLQEELQKDMPDGDAVRLVLRVLKSRERSHMVACDQDAEKAYWSRGEYRERYQRFPKSGWSVQRKMEA